MNIYSILSVVNICLAVLLIVSAGYRLSADARHNVQQAVAGTMVLAVCLVIMHTISILNPKAVVFDMVTLLWGFVDMLCTVVLLNLIRALPIIRKTDGL